MIETGERRVSVNRCAWVVLGAVLLSACAGAPPAPTPTIARVWPLPPDPPRIAYVKSLTGPEEARSKKGWFRRALERLVGQGEAAPRMIRPFGMFVDEAGVLFVTDTGVQGGHRFDPEGGGYRQVFRMSGGRGPPSAAGVAGGRGGAPLRGAFLP